MLECARAAHIIIFLRFSDAVAASTAFGFLSYVAVLNRLPSLWSANRTTDNYRKCLHSFLMDGCDDVCVRVNHRAPPMKQLVFTLRRP